MSKLGLELGPRRAKTGRLALAALAGCMIGHTQVGAAADGVVATLNDRQNADRLLIVDCLLPGQVRQLGTGVTYMAPRRAIKTTGSDCAIRGGEYTANDRANYATALKVWLPPAQSGDKVAQTYVGEIYEKGLGIAPDYAGAASWYQKAADQGYCAGHDQPWVPVRAGAWRAQGSGCGLETLPQGRRHRRQHQPRRSGPPRRPRRNWTLCAKELERTRQDLERARRLLDQERLKSGSEIERLTQKKLQAAAAGNAEETRRLESLLKEREAELEKRRQEVAQFERTNEDFRARLTGLEGESASLRQQLEQARRQLTQSQREVEDKKNAAIEAERRLDAMQQEIARQKSAAAPVDPARIKALEAELQKNKTEFERQKQEIIRLEADVTSYKDAVAKLEARPQPAKQVVAMAPPSIQIIDPPIVVTRDTATVKVRAGLNKRTVVGRVTAPAGLLSFTANDVLQEVDADGYFKTSVELGRGSRA